MRSIPARSTILVLVLPLCAAFLTAAAGGGSGSAVLPLLSSIEGAETVTVVRGFDAREAGPGTQIKYGDKVKTPPQATATILYPDGSQLIVSAGSEFQIQARVKGADWGKLKVGEVHGLIQKAPTAGKIHFLIRTKSAVLGVRGTDFVMGMDAAHGVAQVHTLEGSVEVGRNAEAVLEGRGVAVGEGQYVKATPSGLSPVQSFDPQEFLDSRTNGGQAAQKLAQLDRPMRGPTPGPAPGPPPPYVPAPLPSIKPPPEAKAQFDEKKKKEEVQESWFHRFHPLAFSAGAFFCDSLGSGVFRAVNLAWEPLVPVPGLNFLYIRGHAGGNVFQDGSINNNFLVREFEAFGVIRVSRFFAEAGWGYQQWVNYGLDGQIVSANAGIMIAPNGIIDRIYIGGSFFQLNPKLQEYKVGLGLTLF